MNDLDALAFSALFKEAYQKCFGHAINESLSETESKLFSNEIFDQTGLVIGPKSIKNYSLYILNSCWQRRKPFHCYNGYFSEVCIQCPLY